MAESRVLPQFLLLLVVLLVVLFAVFLVLRLHDRVLDVLVVLRRLRLDGGEHAGHRGRLLWGGVDHARGDHGSGRPGAVHDGRADPARPAGRDRDPLISMPAR